MSTTATLLFVFPAVMAFAGAMDLLTMTIPNRINLGIAALFVIVAMAAGLPLATIASHLAAGAIVLVACFAVFAFGGFGGGDAKLLAAASLWIGFDHLTDFLIGVTLAGGLLAVAILAYRRCPIINPHLPEWAIRLHARGTGIPYGIAIAASALMVYPKTQWFPMLASLTS